MSSSKQSKHKSLANNVRQKLFITSISLLLIASISFLVMEWFAARHTLVNRISLQSELIAEHLTAAVSFEDHSTAEKFLSSLSNDEDIVLATVYDTKQKIFVSYTNDSAKTTLALPEILQSKENRSIYQFTLSNLHFCRSILLGEQEIGTLYIKVSLLGFWMKLLAYLIAVSLVVVILTVILRKVSDRFHKEISEPIDLILERMAQIQVDGDYSIRMEINRTDELGTIMSQFNAMVTKIEQRDLVLIQKNNEIEKHAFYDPLTGLPNRRLLTEQLKHEIHSISRTESYGAVFYIDLDNFKTINDSLGHDTGDRLLVEAAQRIRQSLRESDICARIGGDEFLAVLPDLGADTQSAVDSALSISEQLRLVLTQSILIDKRSIHTSASIGISLYNNSTESAQEILKQADMAMYAAKNAGRNCTHFFSDEMQEEAINRLNLEEELRAALIAPDESFELYYQAQVDSHGQCIGAEALIRWHHKNHGLVMPGKFIALAENTGLITPLGNWIIDKACKQLALWQKEGKNIGLAINVSPNQFLSDGFAENVKQHLLKYSVQPLSLEIEITESLILDDKNKAVAIMTELRKVGVTFSIDDFGTGYSSLQYLTSLPISKLKIDQSFVRDITTDKNDAAIVKTIILMTRNLGLQVLAEGVETEVEYDFLLQNGCGLFQGYLFSKPICLEAFQHLSQSNLSAEAIERIKLS